MTSGGKPLRMQRLGALADRRGRALEVTRLDLLLSDFALQHADGRWTQPGAWHGFFRAQTPTRREALAGIAPGTYTAARFSVGVQPDANHADPNRLAPEDPLHPVVNGMHWGWTGGYIFVALEGHWQFDHAPRGSTGGFSYHLAGNAHRVGVTLPTPLVVRQGSVLRLDLDAARLLAPIDIARDGDSTHSRARDPVVQALEAALPGAFRISVAKNAGPPAADAMAMRRQDAVGRADRREAAAIGREPFPMHVGAHMPRFVLPDDNVPTAAGVELGRALFHDPRLSRDGSLACAGCHRDGHARADGGKPVSTGVGGKAGTRNTMPLFNLAWADSFFWDGRARTLRQQALEPIVTGHEMAATLPRVVAKLSADGAMVARFRVAFGGPPTAERIGLALEQFMLTLVAQDAKFDRVMRGSDRFTPQEQRGFDLFVTEHDPRNGLFGADCFHCHGGALFTNQQFANNGLPPIRGDVGRERVTRDRADRGKFKTPSLRNVALTSPYMHDGRLRTLEDVVEHYDRGVERSSTLDPNLAKHPKEGLGLSPQDKAALVAFLKTLTDLPARAR